MVSGIFNMVPGTCLSKVMVFDKYKKVKFFSDSNDINEYSYYL